MLTILNNNQHFTCKEGDNVKIRVLMKSNYKEIIKPLAVPSCGCTQAFITPEVKPDEEFSLSLVFNSKGRVGKNLKSVKVLVNEDEYKIKFTVDVTE